MRSVHTAGAVALACACLLLLPAAGAAAPRATLAITGAPPDETLTVEADDQLGDRLLTGLDAVPGLHAGLVSTAIGAYERDQALLDLSQGARRSAALYEPEEVPALLALRNGRVLGFQDAVLRARSASAALRPGLLGATVPGGAAYAGPEAGPRPGAVAAMGADGKVARMSLGGEQTVVARARRLRKGHGLVVVDLPRDATGALAATDELARTMAPDELLVVVHLPPTPLVAGRSAAPREFTSLAAVAVASEREGAPTSATTRTPALISTIDVLPTIARHLGVAPPPGSTGEPVRAGPVMPVASVEAARARWSEVRARQAATLLSALTVALAAGLLMGAFGALAAAGKATLRIGALAVVWWPAAALVPALVERPSAELETALVGILCLAGALACDRLLGWPRAVAVPAFAALGGLALALAFAPDLIGRSVIGPSVIAGARFYGVSNEIEPVMPILLLVGIAAVAGARPRSGRLAGATAAAALALGVMVGAGRLGADVGGVITVAAAGAVATLLLLPGGLTRRRLAIGLAAPVAALAALILLDLVASGGSGHLTRALTRAEGLAGLLELVQHRYELALHTLAAPSTAVDLAFTLIAVLFAWRNREWLLEPVVDRPAWRAAIYGGLAGALAGALTNDSGPLLLVNGGLALAVALAYVHGRPPGAAGARTAEATV